jgi:hypothetical protein
MAIWYIFPRFGTFLPVLVCCTKKNLATLLQARNDTIFCPAKLPVATQIAPLEL